MFDINKNFNISNMTTIINKLEYYHKKTNNLESCDVLLISNI